MFLQFSNPTHLRHSSIIVVVAEISWSHKGEEAKESGNQASSPSGERESATPVVGYESHIDLVVPKPARKKEDASSNHPDPC
jgi:hypothetical protein